MLEWEQYVKSQELPELCPSCGAENVDETGEWVDPAHPPFCSIQCANEHRKKIDEETEEYARFVKEEWSWPRKRNLIDSM